jgi:Tol biopolymer transport system component
MSRQRLAVTALVLVIVLIPLAASAPTSQGSPPDPFAPLAFVTATPTATGTPFPTATPTFTPTPTATRPAGLPPLPTATPIRPFPFAPLLIAPAREATLPSVGPLELRWNLPAGATQYQVQVLPANGDGPGLNLIRGAESSYTIPAPVLGTGPYILLPGMRYVWRVRATDKPDFAPENDRAWGQWSEIWEFTTAQPSSAGITPETPPDGGVVATAGTQLVWRNRDPAVFYYEVQVSGDPRFDPDPATATSFVWWNLVHSGMTEPPNSWRTPPLAPGTTYYWRVRPRVQGGGIPVAWGPTWRFTTGSALFTPTPTPTPTHTPAPGARIAFVSHREGSPDLYAMNSDGRGLTRLTVNGAIEGRPVWSPDGARLAFITVRDNNKELYVMNADGSSPKNLSNDHAADEQPAWSPDGSQLVWVSQRDGNPEVYSIYADGTNLRRLTNTGDAEEAPVWAPNGGYIAFVTNRDGNKEIYIMNPGGGGQLRRTNHPGVDEQPAWSPDSSKIAFVSDRHGNQEIYLLDPYKAPEDQPEPKRLTDNTFADYGPVWSPNGQKIAFISTRDGNPEIYVMNADGTNQVRLTNNLAADSHPSWSPDSRRIVFSTNRDGNNEIYVMNADGADQVNITMNSAADLAPAWAPR